MSLLDFNKACIEVQESIKEFESRKKNFCQARKFFVEEIQYG